MIHIMGIDGIGGIGYRYLYLLDTIYNMSIVFM